MVKFSVEMVALVPSLPMINKQSQINTEDSRFFKNIQVNLYRKLCWNFQYNMQPGLHTRLKENKVARLKLSYMLRQNKMEFFFLRMKTHIIQSVQE